MLMRSRSSRLFIVLLHLVGVSTNLPKNKSQYYWSGIVGVHPVDILSETLDLDIGNGLDGLLARLPFAYRDAILSQPYWLQDDSDGRCLGPEGFSECGDATLWLIRRRQHTADNSEDEKRSKTFSSLLSPGQIYESHVHVENWGYALELVDTQSMPPQSFLLRDEISKKNSQSQQRTKNDNKKRERQKKERGECLIAERRKMKRNSRERRAELLQEPGVSLGLGKCSISKAWNWNFDGRGLLSKDIKKSSSPRDKLCVWRENNSTLTFGAPCRNTNGHDRIVEFSLVRYQASPTIHGNVSPSEESLSDPKETTNAQDAADDSITTQPPTEHGDSRKHMENDDDSDLLSASFGNTKVQGSSTLPHTKTLSEMHAHQPAAHPELKPMSSLLSTSLSVAKTASVLKASQPSLMNTLAIGNNSNNNPKQLHATTPSKKDIHHSPTYDMKMSHPRKIPVHPYIAASKNQVWTDPQTGLKFRTDLCEYLGHSKKERGRHTLMGVGQYTKTVFNVKVYGVAFYVSKRDALADPSFTKFSHLTTSELQSNEEFYSYLMSPPTDDTHGVDRTILLKLNMQLGTDTMRSALESDWKLLTEEHIHNLLTSSLTPRPAKEPMLQKIMSEDNPGRCSCSQLAPEEYKADPSCCARGTELVFTWTKANNFEIRLDGELMDTYSGDMGRGIFYEYLRGDEPMSADARLHFADGFPFLLAPLAQIKGFSLGHNPDANHHKQQQQQQQQTQNRLDVPRMAGEFAGMLANNANGFASWMQSQADQTLSNVARAPKIVEQSIRDTGSFLNKKRQQATHQVVTMSAQSMGFIVQKIPFIPEDWKKRTFANSIAISHTQDGTRNVSSNGSQSARFCEADNCESSGWRRIIYTDDLIEDDGPSLPFFDEIGVIVTPALDFTHRLYLYMVHLYLMLLFIVSFPESHGTRTRLVVSRRRRNMFSNGKTICSGRMTDLSVSLHVTLHEEPLVRELSKSTMASNTSQQELQSSNIKKSLSYYL